jgi:hypothetical protein
MNNLTINLNKQEEQRLSRLALSYGLSLPELFHKILNELENSIPTENLEDYDQPRALKISLNKAMKDIKEGRILTSL